MTSFPGSPRLPKASIVSIDSITNLIINTISFQYNPETVTRDLSPRIAKQDNASREDVFRIEGAPTETFSLKIILDATDYLEKADPMTVSFGVTPQISALEMLIYPSSIRVAANEVMAALGGLEIVPPPTPLTVLVWNKNRVIPVKITSLQIEEESYDALLNPIRAHVTMDLKVLTYNDLPRRSKGSALFFSHHVTKEGLGRLARSNNLSISTAF